MAEPNPAGLSRQQAAKIESALRFASGGFGIFSVWSATSEGVCRCRLGLNCTSPAKHPIPPNGFLDATRDPDKIRTMLSAGSEPNYGMVPPEGCVLLDVDGADGLEKWAELERGLGTFETFRTVTAAGMHVFVRWPDDLPRPLKQIFGFVSRWGSGQQAGYVIGPGSVHASGFIYHGEGGTYGIAEFPRPWAEAALAEQKPGPVFTVGGEKPLPEPGHRHEWLRDRARYFRGVGLSPDALRAALLAENARLSEPKTEADVDRAIGEVFERFPADPPEQAEARADARLSGAEDLGFISPVSTADFPAGPDEEAFGGRIGECVAELEAGTDASRVGLLGSLIAFLGVLVPGRAYFHRMQTSSPFVALVGESAIGRKGTAMLRAQNALEGVFGSQHVAAAIMDGLASGEGMVSTLHYRQTRFGQEPTVGLVFEEEYASLLAARGREGSTLDPKMRAGFDGSVLSNRRSNDEKQVLPPYWLGALIAITPTELQARIEAGSMTSGSANRWLYLPVQKRSNIPTNERPKLGQQITSALQQAGRRTARELPVEPGVVSTLAEYADWLPERSYGLARDLSRRFSIIAFRVALVHALADGAEKVSASHLRRALALTEYARAGFRWVFGNTIGNRDADLLYRWLLDHERLTKTQISRQIIRDPLRQQAAIDELSRLGLAEVRTMERFGGGGGRMRSELVLTSAKYQTTTNFHGSATESPRDVQSVEILEVTEWGSGNLVEDSGKIEVDSPPIWNTGTWCYYVSEHSFRHRDVATPDPWCEVCSPREPA